MSLCVTLGLVLSGFWEVMTVAVQAGLWQGVVRLRRLVQVSVAALCHWDWRFRVAWAAKLLGRSAWCVRSDETSRFRLF